MSIQCLGCVSIKTTYKKRKPWKVKKTYLYGDLELIAEGEYSIKGIYIDQTGNKYICTKTSSHRKKVFSYLKIVSTYLGEKFSTPINLTLVGHLLDL